MHVNINEVDNNKCTALIYACKYGHEACVKHLLDNRGADISHRDRYKKDAMEWSKVHEHPICAELLKEEMMIDKCRERHRAKFEFVLEGVLKKGAVLMKEEQLLSRKVEEESKRRECVYFTKLLAKSLASECMSVCKPNRRDRMSNNIDYIGDSDDENNKDNRRGSLMKEDRLYYYADEDDFYIKLPSLIAAIEPKTTLVPSSVSSSLHLPDQVDGKSSGNGNGCSKGKFIMKNDKIIDVEEVARRSKWLVHQMHKQRSPGPRNRNSSNMKR